MTWIERISVEEVRNEGDRPTDPNVQMNPGITGQYDHDLREKAGMHTPPPPPENMGLEGEFDPGGLAKRVAVALDQQLDFAKAEKLCIVQQGSTIRFHGQAPSRFVLERIVKTTGQVDGVKQIETGQVAIAV